MSQLALRMWTGTEMIYPVKFSVMFDPLKKKSSVRAFVKNEKFITFNYMLITPFSAVNGPIFEMDLLIMDNNEDDIYLVELNPDKCVYVLKNIKDNSEHILDVNHRYEIIGNIYEDKDLISEELYNELYPDDNNDFNNKKNEEIIVNDDNKTNSDEANNEEKENPSLKEEEISVIEQDSDKIKEIVNDDVNNGVDDINNENEPLNSQEETVTETILILDENVEKDEISETMVDNIVEDISNEEDNSLDEPSETVENILENINENDYVDEYVPKNIYENKSDYIADIDIHFYSNLEETGKYAFTFVLGKNKDVFKGSEDAEDKKQLDLIGIIAALEMLEGKFNVTVFTDSQYVVCPFYKGWIQKWYDSKWYKNSTDMIKNHELWFKLYELNKQFNIKWELKKEPTDEMKDCEKVLDME